ASAPSPPTLASARAGIRRRRCEPLPVASAREREAERVVAVALAHAVDGAVERTVVAEERQLPLPPTQPRQGDPEQANGGPTPPRAPEQIADHGVELELRARRRDGTRACQRLEVGVAQLERHRPRPDAAPARAPADPLAQRAQHRLDAARIAHVLAEGALVGDAADDAAGRIVLRERGPLASELVRAAAAAADLNALGPGAEDSPQRSSRRGRDLRERLQPELMQLRLGDRPAPRELAPRRPAEERH